MEYKDQINSACKTTSEAIKAKGFHEDDQFMLEIACHYVPSYMEDKFKETWTRNRKLARIALIHSELSEAVEAIRKDAMDDKLTHRKGEEVELADTLTRIFDHAGYYGYDLGGAFDEVQANNLSRPHKHGKLV